MQNRFREFTLLTSNVVRTINKIMRIRIVVQIPALPEGKEEK